MKLHHAAPLGAPKPMKLHHSAPTGAPNPMKMQHAAPLGLSLGLQTLCEYSMRRPWGLPWSCPWDCKPYANTACGALGAYLSWTPSYFLRNYIGEGVPIPPPRAPPPAVRIAHGAPRAHPRVRARFACTLARHSQRFCIPRASRSPTANSHARRRQLRRISRGSPIAGASGSPTAKLEPRRRSTCTPAGACAIRAHAGAAQCQCCPCHLRAS